MSNTNSDTFETLIVAFAVAMTEPDPARVQKIFGYVGPHHQ